jgi:hypothetical protein
MADMAGIAGVMAGGIAGFVYACYLDEHSARSDMGPLGFTALLVSLTGAGAGVGGIIGLSSGLVPEVSIPLFGAYSAYKVYTIESKIKPKKSRD